MCFGTFCFVCYVAICTQNVWKRTLIRCIEEWTKLQLSNHSFEPFTLTEIKIVCAQPNDFKLHHLKAWLSCDGNIYVGSLQIHTNHVYTVTVALLGHSSHIDVSFIKRCESAIRKRNSPNKFFVSLAPWMHELLLAVTFSASPMNAAVKPCRFAAFGRTCHEIYNIHVFGWKVFVPKISTANWIG